MTRPNRHLRRGVAYVRIVAFLVTFAGLLIFVVYHYLFPAMRVWPHATEAQRKLLAAQMALLLAVLLAILFVGLLLTFRISRFFFPAKRPPRTRTVYPDAWAESARRIQVDPPEEEGP